MPTPAQIKKALQTAGFEIYRTRGEVVHVAERVRENLLMDSGVFVVSNLEVGFVARAQKSDFPNDGDDALFARARALGAAALAKGYAEKSAEVRSVADPGDTGRVIDRWCEVAFHKTVEAIEIVVDEVRFVISLEKAAVPP